MTLCRSFVAVFVLGAVFILQGCGGGKGGNKDVEKDEDKGGAKGDFVCKKEVKRTVTGVKKCTGGAEIDWTCSAGRLTERMKIDFPDEKTCKKQAAKLNKK